MVIGRWFVRQSYHEMVVEDMRKSHAEQL